MDKNTTVNNKKKLIRDLAKYDFVPKTVMPVEDIAKLKKDDDVEILDNMYSCQMDDLTNTRILLGIFKCVNFIKNVLIAGLVCGGVGIILAVMK